MRLASLDVNVNVCTSVGDGKVCLEPHTTIAVWHELWTRLDTSREGTTILGHGKELPQ